MPLNRRILLGAAGLISVCAFAGLDGSYVLPLDHAAIQYETRALTDPVTRIAAQLRRGEVKLDYNPQTGYLAAVLKLLQVPVSSQVLVYSKTSFQAPRISPQTPRALYYNDNVAVGYVKGGDVLEIAAIDPQAGAVFFTLDTEQVPNPRIERRTNDCLQCHQSGGTLGIPGLMVRSVYPDRNGQPMFQAGSFVTDHRSPLQQRWGGWYVTGTSGSQEHMGNAVIEEGQSPDSIVGKGSNVTDLKWRFDESAYLSSHSDIVALMVLEHQTRMSNLITRVNYETRMAILEQSTMNRELKEPPDYMSDSVKHRIASAAEEIVKYMLFTDEAAILSEIKGTSAFTSEFARKGPTDHLGRSLRDLDLKHRMFRYPCSYLIYSEAFDGLADEAKQYVYRRLWEVLSGHDQSKPFARLSSTDRQNILAILRETKKDLPEYWNAAGEQ
jgi:hypothetical protein